MGATGTEKGIWYGMINRCTNPKMQNWRHYGGRGIKVCPRWLNSFDAFYADMGARPSTKYSVERRDNNGNYEPKNCYWATVSQQQSNRRSPSEVNPVPIKRVVPITKMTPKPIRWYARDRKDLARLLAAGAVKGRIYEAEKGETADKISMRAGEYLGIVDGYLAFGKTRRQIGPAVDRLHSQGAFILDVETGRDSRTQGAAMFNDALDPPKPSAEYLAAKRKEKADARRNKNGVMPVREAFVIWRNPKMSVEEKLDLMHGWTKSLAYKELRITGAPAGRRPKQATA